jgi:hypothetical protein
MVLLKPFLNITMKLTKDRLQKTINNTNKQTRKKLTKEKKVLNHTNTMCYKKHNTKQFNLRNRTLKHI